mmetsp:Transcript_94321/g.172909  ORF Transcript_94321/g.172909 Transcript_94321/m.172909 type:complete len:283 (-) Transcript_94321:20-868(-)
MLHHSLIEILTTQVSITVGCNNFKNTIVNSEQRYIESATAQVVHKDVLLRLLVKSVCNRCSSGLVDDSEHLHTRDSTRILCGLPLGVIEISRHGDDCMLHFLAQVVLSCLLHLHKNHCRDLLRRHCFVLTTDLDTDLGLATLVHDLERQQLDVLLHCGILEAAANQALHVKESLRGVHSCLVFRRLADQALVFSECHIGWSDSIALIVWDNLNSAILVDAYAGVGGSKVNTNDWSIDLFLIIVLGKDSTGHREKNDCGCSPHASLQSATFKTQSGASSTCGP